MNTIEFIRQCLAYVSFTLAAALVLALAVIYLRKPLRVLLDRWRGIGLLGRLVAFLFTTVFVLYGGSKLAPPSSTNEPPSLGMTGQGPGLMGNGNQGLGTHLSNPDLTLLSFQPSPLTARWNARGAWKDWQRIEFPSGFAFPVGTNTIGGLTILSCGELRQALTNTTPIAALPRQVSLEPGVSTFDCGPTASNSFLVSWQNVCVERCATNRVDASIELFDSGDRIIRFGEDVTHVAAPLPEGYVGEGQNLAWATNAFPEHASAIVTNMDYSTWAMGYVGINEQNGRYLAKITIEELPESGPCYLECGPYKVVVKEPGTYSFPLEVFQEYTAITYPTSVPLSVEYDDGYRGDATMQSASAPSLQAYGPRRPGPIRIFMEPFAYISPCVVQLEQAQGTRIKIWCNIANAIRSWRSLSGLTYLAICGSDAEILSAAVTDYVVVTLQAQGHEVTGVIIIAGTDPTLCMYCLEGGCPCNGHCSDFCSCHTVTNGTIRCCGSSH